MVKLDFNVCSIPNFQYNYQKLDSKENNNDLDGVIFSTYDTLISVSNAGKSRLNQLIQWCGDDFDGVIVFDESHKAKKLFASKKGNESITGHIVMKLQMRLPLARIVYASATGEYNCLD